MHKVTTTALYKKQNSVGQVSSLMLKEAMEEERHPQFEEEPFQQILKLESQFQLLRQKHNQNTFILVGPSNSFFQGIFLLQFANLDLDDKIKLQQPSDKIRLEQSLNMIPQIGKAVDMFQATISNKPPNVASNQIICIEDSDEQQLQSSKAISTKSKTLFELPLFQNDGIHYTPTFAAECSKSSKSQYYYQFMNKVKDYRREVSRDWIMQPRPRSKYMYCAICKDHYDEYLAHVNSRRHLQNYQKNKFTRYITNLELTINTGRFKKEKQIQEKRRATYEKKRLEQQQNKNTKKKEKKQKKEKKKANSKQNQSESQGSSSSSSSSSSNNPLKRQDLKIKRQSSPSQSQNSNSAVKKRQRTRDKKNKPQVTVKRKRGRPRKCKEENINQNWGQLCKKE